VAIEKMGKTMAEKRNQRRKEALQALVTRCRTL
jgi:hypothetical protein